MLILYYQHNINQFLIMKPNARQFKVEISFIEKKIFMKYQYINPVIHCQKGIEYQIQTFIKNKLKVGLRFPFAKSKFKILDDKKKQSGMSGNYQFDPFFYCVKIELSSNQQFNSIKLKPEDKIKFLYTPVDNFEESSVKNFKKFKDDTPFQEVLEKISDEFQFSPQKLQFYKDNFKKFYLLTLGSIKGWNLQKVTSQFRNLQVPATISKRIYQLSNQFQQFSSKSYVTKKVERDRNFQQCVKIANSHRVLRYLISQNSPGELHKISFLNYKNIKNAFQIVQKHLKIEKQILQQVQSFLFQYGQPQDSTYNYSRGAIFNGPPGTGKTVMTQLLMYLSGFNPISQGVSAADFMKSLVGQAGQAIEDLFSRANICPYLPCSISIDEIQGAFPTRSNSQQKNNSEIISKFLTLIEGNQNIKNLFIFSATNHINKIDDAVLRRLGDRIDLTRLSKEHREQILGDKFTGNELKEYYKSHTSQKNLLIKLSMNFTGAAWDKLQSQFQSLLINKIYFSSDQKNPKPQITDSQLRNLVHRVAMEYKITFGPKTLPQIEEINKHNKKYITKQFLQKAGCNFFFIVAENSKKILEELTIGYTKKQMVDGKATWQLQEQNFNCFNSLEKKDYQSAQNLCLFFRQEIKKIFDMQPYIEIFDNKKKINSTFDSLKNKKHKEPIILLIQDLISNQIDNQREIMQIISQINGFERIIQNVYIFYICINITIDNYIGLQKPQKDYTGRIIIEINQPPRIVYEVKPKTPNENQTYIQNYLSSGKKKSKPDYLIPNIVNFFCQRGVNNVFMIDNYFLESRNAFSSEKQIEVIKGIIDEAQRLPNSAIILNIDSLIIEQNRSSVGQNQEKQVSIKNQNLYRSFVSYFTNFANIAKEKELWIAVFIKNERLIEKFRQDTYWPLMPEQIKKKQYQKELNRKRKCIRCGKQYTEKQNQQERTCFQHPGEIIWTVDMIYTKSSLQQCQIEMQLNQYRKEIRDNELKQLPLYVFSCCLANVNVTDNYCSKKNAFRHIQTKFEEDEVQNIKKEQKNIWDRNLQKIKKLKPNQRKNTIPTFPAYKSGNNFPKPKN